MWTRALDATATTDDGLSPMSDRCHSQQGRVMDALAEVVSDRRLATERSARDAALAAHFDLLAERHML